MIEFALVLPLFVLFLIGIFDLGRAFFSYIAISNGAREGARVITFWPGKTTFQNVHNAVDLEVGSSPLVTSDNITNIKIECGNPMQPVASPASCTSGNPVRVTVTYNFKFILSSLLNQSLDIHRSVEMLMP